MSVTGIRAKENSISIGKLRGLQQCSSEQATFTCLALDHRQNLRQALNPANPGSVSDLDLTRPCILR